MVAVVDDDVAAEGVEVVVFGFLVGVPGDGLGLLCGSENCGTRNGGEI
jgi:hypothetical protein